MIPTVKDHGEDNLPNNRALPNLPFFLLLPLPHNKAGCPWDLIEGSLVLLEVFKQHQYRDYLMGDLLLGLVHHLIYVLLLPVLLLT